MKLCRFTAITGYFANVSVCQCRRSIRQHRFQVVEIKVLSIWKNFDRQSGINVEEKILFLVENHVFAAKSLKASEGCANSSGKFPWLKTLKPICFSEHLKQFLELWNALKPFRMWKHFGNPLLVEMVWILFENLLRKCRGKKYSHSLRSLSTCWRMRDSTACHFFCAKISSFPKNLKLCFPL